jgi:hypothetical protein
VSKVNLLYGVMDNGVNNNREDTGDQSIDEHHQSSFLNKSNELMASFQIPNVNMLQN